LLNLIFPKTGYFSVTSFQCKQKDELEEKFYNSAPEQQIMA